jgi:hypothetical protein
MDRKWQKTPQLLRKQFDWHSLSRAVQPHIRRVTQPFTDFDVGCRRIDFNAERAQAAVQRHPKALT